MYAIHLKLVFANRRTTWLESEQTGVPNSARSGGKVGGRGEAAILPKGLAVGRGSAYVTDEGKSTQIRTVRKSIL